MPLGAFRQSLNLANPVAGQEILSLSGVNRMYSTGTSLPANNLQGTSPRAVYFSDDGTSMYAISADNDIIYQYTLSTPWDLSTVSYANKSFSHATQDANSGEGLAFNDTGTTLMLLIRTSTSASTVYQYTLSTAWDISTASYATKNFFVALEGRGLAFRPDGTTMYIGDNTNDRVYQYTLSTAWDISTASYANKQSSVFSNTIDGMAVSKLGDSVIIAPNASFELRSMNITTPWDIATATTETTINYRNLTGTLRDVYISPTSKYLFALGRDEEVYKLVNSSYGVIITRNQNSTITTIGTGSVPQSAANDYAFLFDYSTSTTEVVPSGWTKISSITQTGIRTTISYKKLVSGDVNATITGQATTTNKTLIICRPTVNSNITVSSVNEQATTLTPTNQTLSISNETGTIVGFFVSASTGASTRTFTPRETVSAIAGGLDLRTVMYQGGETPVNHTISMTDGGSNTLQSFWVKFTPV